MEVWYSTKNIQLSEKAIKIGPLFQLQFCAGLDFLHILNPPGAENVSLCPFYVLWLA